MKNKNRSLRRYLTYKHAIKQQEIHKNHVNDIISLGYFKKQNAMDCGNPKCHLCGNPRKSKKVNKKDSLSIQEKRAFIKSLYDYKNI